MVRKLLLKLKLKKYIREVQQIIYSGEPNSTEQIMKYFIGTNKDIDLIYRYIAVMLVAEFKRISIDLLCIEALREIDSLKLDYSKNDNYKNNMVELFKAKAELALAKREWKNIVDDITIK